MEERKAHMFLLGNLKKGHCLEEQCLNSILTLKLRPKREDGKTYGGFIFLRTGTICRLFSA